MTAARLDARQNGHRLPKTFCSAIGWAGPRAMCYIGNMPLDHFVAQTVLGAWCDPKTGKLQAYRKSTGGRFTPTPRGVCARHDDDENPYLETPDLLGQFRSLWEPHWTAAVEGFRQGMLDANNKYALSLGWASMMTTTPTSSDIGAQFLERFLRGIAPLIARAPPPPAALEKMKIEVDPKFAQAQFTRVLPLLALRLYSQPWASLNNATDEPFFTSDNPSAMFGHDNMGSPPAYLLPLAPDLCVTTLMNPILSLPRTFELADIMAHPIGAVSPQVATPAQVRFINSLTVKHAGDIVLSSKSSDDIGALVETLRQYGVKLDFTPDTLEANKTLVSGKLGVGIVR